MRKPELRVQVGDESRDLRLMWMQTRRPAEPAACAALHGLDARAILGVHGIDQLEVVQIRVLRIRRLVRREREGSGEPDVDDHLIHALGLQ